MRTWDRYLTDEDRAIYAQSGWGGRMGMGQRPAVIVVDVNYAFAGDRPEAVAESIRRWPLSCGEAGWQAAEAIKQLLDHARGRRVPVFYTTGLGGSASGLGPGRWKDKHKRTGPPSADELRLGSTILPPITPTPYDLVIHKAKPSAFFGTALVGYLVELGVDSVIICGTTTSGCIRATVLDAFSHNYKVMVVEEGTFDRGAVSHAINLFDMDQKYADVVLLEDAITYLESIPARTFDAQLPGLAATAIQGRTVR